MKAGLKESLKSILIKITALLAFIAINLISYRAFSAEILDNAETPVCQLAEEGVVEDKWKNIRIQIGNVIVAGAETISELGSQLKELVVQQKCLPIPVNCSFASEGLAMGAWVKHRILVKDAVAFGSNTTARLFDQISELKKIGICE